ncbi:MAG: DUF1003 domain-containing protein [Rhodospirillales bacterium]
MAENVETILAFYRREEGKLGRWQRLLEDIGTFMGRPRFLAVIVLFVTVWLAANLMADRFGWPVFDPPPFFWLQGIIGLGALLTATVVLIKQERLSKSEEQRAHLELQVELVTEQKVSKIIGLIEELRRDMPMVKDRHDPEAAVLKERTDPDEVFAAFEVRREAESLASEPDRKPPQPVVNLRK